MKKKIAVIVILVVVLALAGTFGYLSFVKMRIRRRERKVILPDMKTKETKREEIRRQERAV